MYKRILIAILLCLLLAASGSADRFYARTCLTGGTTGCLDDLDITGVSAPNTDDLEDGDVAIVVVGEVAYIYEFDSSSTEATNSPLYIRPEDYSTAGVWHLVSLDANETYGKINVDTDSSASPTSITAAQARGGILVINSLSGTKQFDLPACEAGMSVCVRNSQGNSQILQIDPNGSEYIVMSDGTRTSAGGDYYGATADESNQVCVVSDGTDWYVTSEVGTWSEE